MFATRMSRHRWRMQTRKATRCPALSRQTRLRPRLGEAEAIEAPSLACVRAAGVQRVGRRRASHAACACQRAGARRPGRPRVPLPCPPQPADRPRRVACHCGSVQLCSKPAVGEGGCNLCQVAPREPQARRARAGAKLRGGGVAPGGTMRPTCRPELPAMIDSSPRASTWRPTPAAPIPGRRPRRGPRRSPATGDNGRSETVLLTENQYGGRIGA
jgi:hypothetical protein